VGYSIRITREPWLTFDEWKRAIRGRSDVRLQDAPASARNPTTGVVISIGHRDGDAEVLIDGNWTPCFWWRDGDPADDSPSSALFNAPSDFDAPGSRVRSIARELAKSLNARLVGEDGEEHE
jgi:hypothetical protein